MLIENEVAVPATPAELFELINDVERVAICMPGAQLLGLESEDSYRGRVNVKVGPIGAAFEGVLTFLEVDEADRTIRLSARGADTKGNGEAEADVHVAVVEHPAGSALRIRTDLMIRGKFVQFGKSAIVTVSSKILQQFALNMAGLLERERSGAAVPAGSVGAGPVAQGAHPSPVPVAPGELDGLAALLGPHGSERLKLAGVFLLGCAQGWLVSRAFGRGGGCPR